MKQTIRLNERILHSVIKNSLANMMVNEQIHRQQQLFEATLNENMTLPNRIRRIWWDGNSTIIILGGDGFWYTIYPEDGDGYQEDSSFDKEMRHIVQKIEQAYTNNGCRPNVSYFRGEKPTIYDESDDNEKFFPQLNSWLQKKGFELVEEPDYEKNYGITEWAYSQNAPTDENNEEMLAKTKQMKDVTRDVSYVFGCLMTDNESLPQIAKKALKTLQDKYGTSPNNVNIEESVRRTINKMLR